MRAIEWLGETFTHDGVPFVARLWLYDLPPARRARVLSSPDGATLALSGLANVYPLDGSTRWGNPRAVILIDAETLGRPRALVHEMDVCAVAFGPRGDVIATIGGYTRSSRASFAQERPAGTYAGRVTVFRVSSGEVLRGVDYRDGLAEGVAFSEDGATLFVGGSAGVRAFDLDGGTATESRADDALLGRLERSFDDAAPAPPGERDAVYAEADPAVHASGVTVVRKRADGTLQVREVIPRWSMAHTLDLSPDDRTAVVNRWGGALWDLERGRWVRWCSGTFVGYGSDGAMRYVHHRDRRSFIITDRDRAETALPPAGSLLALAPDGRDAVFQNGGSEWWDLARGASIATVPGRACELSPRGDAAVVLPGDFITRPALLWKRGEAEARIALEVSSGDYHSSRYTFDASGERVAVALHPGRAHLASPAAALFRVEDGARCWLTPVADRLRPHYQLGAGAVAFDPRGEWLAVAFGGGDDYRVLLLRLEDGAWVETIGPFGRTVHAMAFTSDGTRLILAHDPHLLAVIRLRD